MRSRDILASLALLAVSVHYGGAAEVVQPSDIVQPAEVLRLESAEAIAASSHPALAEAAARVRAARANTLQVGLPPNPSIGYLATEIGNDGRAGQQGMFAEQQFIRGNKLELNRAIASQEVRELEQRYQVEQLRVLTAVRIAFYEVYLAQREIELSHQLVGVGEQAASSVEKLMQAQEARRIDVLQAEIELERINVKLSQAHAKHAGAWRRLVAAMGQPNMAVQQVDADLARLAWPHDWNTSREMLLASSPEVAALLADISRARAAIARACVEPVPDVTAQLAMQYDNATQDPIAGVQLGMPIPVWNRNQGGIGRARHELTAASRRLDAVELDLTAKLAERMRQFETAKAQADAYQSGILRRADENLDLVKQSYEAGESGYLEFLTVQRTYFESNLDYLSTLGDVNQAVQQLAGLLVGTRTE